MVYECNGILLIPGKQEMMTSVTTWMSLKAIKLIKNYLGTERQTLHRYRKTNTE